MSGFVVVITGASSGIGLALAQNLPKKPHAKTGQAYNVVLVARREAELKAAVDSINAAAGKTVAAYYVADASKKAEVDAAADFAVKTFGRIDVWVNNAGRSLVRRVLELTPEDIEAQMSVNVYTALFGSQAAVRVFKAQKPIDGQIINVSSLLGRNATLFPEGIAYNGAKHFLNALTDNLRQDVQADEATKNITVSLYSPGLVATEFGVHSTDGKFDNRTMDGAQDVDEVGESLRRTIEERREEVYSRDVYKGMIDGFIAAKAVVSN